MNKLLILGFGSDILSDERIVIQIIEKLKQEFTHADYKQFLTLSLDVLEEIITYEKIIIIDTVKSSQKKPGTVTIYPLQKYQPTLHLENMHDISFPNLIMLGAFLGYSITKDIEIISIEVHDHTTISTAYSSEIEVSFSSIFSKIKKTIALSLKSGYAKTDAF